MAKFLQEVDDGSGWTRWVAPKMRGYKMACCDCGLVHAMQFKAVRVTKKHSDDSWEYANLPHGKFRVMFRVQRDERSTGQIRRHKRKKKS